MKRYEQVPLSDRTKEIILGTLLGDGSLKQQKNYKNVRLQFRHSEKDKDYFYWKVKQLQEIAGQNSVNVQKPDGYSKNKKLRFLGSALPALTKLHELTYKKNTLNIQRKWLNNMTSLSLAVWWCDDGSLIGEGGRKGVFCTDGFDRESVKILAQYLDKVWHIRTKVAPVNHLRGGKYEQYWRLWIRSPEELKKFLRIIIPHIPVEGMLRKILLLYKDSQMQQRWISEVVQLSQFSEDIVIRNLSKKKAKWKHFRE
jgi:hypothetical protein